MIFVSGSDNRRVVREEGGPVWCSCQTDHCSEQGPATGESGDYLDT